MDGNSVVLVVTQSGTIELREVELRSVVRNAEFFAAILRPQPMPTLERALAQLSTLDCVDLLAPEAWDAAGGEGRW
jgi:hypothetical protein